MALIHFSYYSPILTKHTQLYISMPNPDMLSGDKLKTVWLLHGYSGDHSDWQRFSGVERYAMQRGIAIVMPDAANSFYADMAYGPAYFTYLTEELPTHLRKLFPLSDKREDNFVGGLSSGGYGAMKIGLTYPERYAGIGCLSAYNIPEDFSWQAPDKPEDWRRMFSLVYGDLFPNNMMGSEHDLYHLVNNVLSHDCPRPHIFHIWGDRDVARRGAKITNEFFLALPGDPFIYFGREYPGAHDFDFWDGHLEEMLDYFGLPQIGK
ncbi:MAG: hypothetical protein IKZ30_06915 [Oscillospiraceae bacterium]|nr:hypothetical protein [Oscillospiraceae bacterium]